MWILSHYQFYLLLHSWHNASTEIRPDPPTEEDVNRFKHETEIADDDEQFDNATQDSEGSKYDSDHGYDSDEQIPPYNGEYNQGVDYTYNEQTKTSTFTTSSTYPTPREVIYSVGSDDAEDRIANMLDSMTNIQMTLAIKGKKVAMERKMSMHSNEE